MGRHGSHKPAAIPEVIQKAFRLHIFTAKLKKEELKFKNLADYANFVKKAEKL